MELTPYGMDRRDSGWFGSSGYFLSAFFASASVAFQPVVERGNSRVESADIVVRREAFRGADLPRAGHRPQGALDVSKRRSLGLSAGERSKAPVKRLKVFSSTRRNRRSTNTVLASRHAASITKSERFWPSSSAALTMNARWRRLARRLIATSRGCRSFVRVAGMGTPPLRI